MPAKSKKTAKTKTKSSGKGNDFLEFLTRDLNFDDIKANNMKTGKKNSNGKSENGKSKGEAKKQGGGSVSMYRGIAYLFIFLVVILLGVIFYFSFAGVKITIIPNQERTEGNVFFQVYDKSNDSFSGKDKAIEGAVKKVNVSFSKEYVPTGEKILSEEVVGKAVVYNNYNKSQPLVATTRLLTADDKLFRIKNTVNVPAGGQVEVEIYADQPGESMVIGPSKFTIPGLWAGLQDQIYAESAAYTEYEKEVERHIAQADIDSAVKDAKSGLLEEAKNKADNGYNKFFFKLDDNSIVQDISGKVDEKKDKFTVKLSADVVVIAFDNKEAEEAVMAKFNNASPGNQKLLGFEDDNISYTLSEADADEGLAVLNASFAGKLSLSGTSDIINPNELVGLTDAQLKKYLDSLDEVAGYEIKFYPSFVKRAPKLPDRIKIMILSE